MPTLIFEVPEDSDFWPCPNGCGGATEDEAGGPCKRCWDRGLSSLRSLDDPLAYFPEGTEPDGDCSQCLGCACCCDCVCHDEPEGTEP